LPSNATLTTVRNQLADQAIAGRRDRHRAPGAVDHELGGASEQPASEPVPMRRADDEERGGLRLGELVQALGQVRVQERHDVGVGLAGNRGDDRAARLHDPAADLELRERPRAGVLDHVAQDAGDDQLGVGEAHEQVGERQPVGGLLGGVERCDDGIVRHETTVRRRCARDIRRGPRRACGTARMRSKPRRRCSAYPG
jgi:hypothetical protein